MNVPAREDCFEQMNQVVGLVSEDWFGRMNQMDDLAREYSFG